MVSIFVELESNEMFYFIVKHSRLCVIDFYADWCGPCKKLAPSLNNAVINDKSVFNNVYVGATLEKKLLEGKIVFLKINIDNFQELTEAFNIETIPHIVLCKPLNNDGGFVPVDKVENGNVDNILKSVKKNY